MPKLNAGMAEPMVMASAFWGDEPVIECDIGTPALLDATAADKAVSLNWSEPATGDVSGYSLYYDQSGKAQKVEDLDCSLTDCTRYIDTGLSNGQSYCYKVTAWNEQCESAFSNILCATPQPPGHLDLAGASILRTRKWMKDGKGKGARVYFLVTSEFAAGDQLLIQMQLTDDGGSPLPGAAVNLAISGPESSNVVSGSSDADGLAEAAWTTQRPNKKGNGGTTAGEYTATITGLSASSHDWDGIADDMIFSIGGNSGSMMHKHH